MTDQVDYSDEEAEFDSLEGETCDVAEDGDQSIEINEALASQPKGFAGEPERISENIAGRVPSWRGVRSCSDESRAVREMMPHYKAWVAATIAAHPDRVALAQGYSGKRKWRNETTGSGRRKCKGWWTSLTVYVDFA